jgi:hypothetical protein
MHLHRDATTDPQTEGVTISAADDTRCTPAKPEFRPFCCRRSGSSTVSRSEVRVSAHSGQRRSFRPLRWRRTLGGGFRDRSHACNPTTSLTLAPVLNKTFSDAVFGGRSKLRTAWRRRIWRTSAGAERRARRRQVAGPKQAAGEDGGDRPEAPVGRPGKRLVFIRVVRADLEWDVHTRAN